MLLKILRMRGVGYLHDPLPTPPGQPTRTLPLTPQSVFYGENGRGKSTLAAVLRSLSQGDHDTVNGRATIGGSHVPDINLLIGKQQVKFSGGAWSQSCPEIVVFDSHFVDTNVYSGAAINSEQRRQLLDFVLGAEMVARRQRVDDLTSKISALTSAITAAKKGLTAVAQPYAVDRFLDLTVDEE